jgi:cobalt-zinc-cadmium efflux system membrane fusion protein
MMLRKSSLIALLLLATLAACNRSPAPAAPDEDQPASTAAPIARISAAAAKTVGIALAKAGPADIRETLTLYGVVRPNAEKVREVIARFPGTVKTVGKAIGDAVKQGEVLATIESNESLQTYALTAPITGIVTAREADPGEQAGSEVLFSIADASSVWVELSLFPADAARVHGGQAVVIDSVGGDLQGSGRIGLVGVFGSGANQALTARVLLPNEQRRWTPGLFVNGAVELSKTTVPVAVAATALQTVDGRSVVFVPVEGGYAARAVKTGRADAALVEVLEGLAAGDDYVAVNSFVVKADLGKAALQEDDDAAAAKNDDDQTAKRGAKDEQP